MFVEWFSLHPLLWIAVSVAVSVGTLTYFIVLVTVAEWATKATYQAVSCRFRYPQRFLLYAGVYIFVEVLYGFTMMGTNCQTDSDHLYICPVLVLNGSGFRRDDLDQMGLRPFLREATCDATHCAEISPVVRSDLKAFFLIQFIVQPLNYLIYMRFIRYYPELIKNLRRPLFDKKDKKKDVDENSPLVVVAPKQAEFAGLVAVNFWYFFLSSVAYLWCNTLNFTVIDDPDESVMMFCVIVMVTYHVTLLDNLIGIEGGTMDALSARPSNQILSDDIPYRWKDTSAKHELLRVPIEMALLLTGPVVFFVCNLDSISAEDVCPSLALLVAEQFSILGMSFDLECLMLLGALCLVLFTVFILLMRGHVAVTTIKKRFRYI
ncbi:hypothetical protein KIPB_001534 [Kipferlia bialata]|uniref:Uncharacterized protein n=1 Tax=Kipferlia bialata TaxID=797122 RepID=A0A9K3GFB5_9EUKA|nr:hypothetical protein KIPB_001534 [Kipferlia bialata]|eukprot:g1534.t1